jgi:hypothetical protein
MCSYHTLLTTTHGEAGLLITTVQRGDLRATGTQGGVWASGFATTRPSRLAIIEGPIRRTREGGGSEWGPIKILLEGVGGSNKMNTASNTRLRLTTQVGQAHAATVVLLNLGTNSRPHRPENTAEHKTRASLTYAGQAGEHHRSDRSLLVKPGDFHRTALTPVRPVWHIGQTGPSQKAPNTKQAYRAPKRPKLETAATRDNSELTQTFTRAKPNRVLHRSDR